MRFYLLLILSLIFSCNSPENSSSMLEPGVSLSLAQDRKAQIENLQYELEFRIPQQKTDTIAGKAIISFELQHKKQPLILDFNVPESYLHQVSIEETAIPYTFEQEHIQIDTKYLKKGKNNIHIQFRAGETSLNRQEEFLYSLFVPDRARTAFPCFDQPNLKAKYKLTLHIPKTWKALANGAAIRAETNGIIKTIEFAETKVIPTYLFNFVVGKFEVITKDVDGVEMTMLHRETDEEKVARNADAVFQLHKIALDWLEAYTNIPYPFQKFGFALIPSFQYGGMEHPGAITYKASSLFLDEHATQNQLLSRASLIAHETAHMWFGDLVTMDWFNDVWLKEVFANFMAAKMVHPSFPEINHDLRFLLRHYPSAYTIDRSLGSHPVQQELDNLKNAGTLYGAIIYQKAPIAMRMLELQLGADKLQEGLRTYLNTYAFENATWDDLIGILNTKTENDLASWSKDWIKTEGMPTIKVQKAQRKISIKPLDAESKNWPQTLNLVLKSGQLDEFITVDITSSSLSHEAKTNLTNIDYIIPNSKGIAYGYFPMDEDTKTYLLENIHHIPNTLYRGASWLNLWENMLHQEVSTTDLLSSLLNGIKTEIDPLIQQRLLSYLQTLYWQFLTDEERKTQVKVVANTLWESFEKLKNKRHKKAYFKTYQAIVETPEGINRLYNLWNTSLQIEALTLSEQDFTDLAYQLALRKPKQSYQILMEQLGRTNNTDRKARMEFIIPALSPNEATRDAFFERLKQLENRQIEPWVQEAVGYLHHPLRRNTAVQYIRPTLELLEELQGTGDIFFPKRVLDNTFNRHNSKSVCQQVEAFLESRPDYPRNLKNKIYQASDLVFRAANLSSGD